MHALFDGALPLVAFPFVFPPAAGGDADWGQETMEDELWLPAAEGYHNTSLKVLAGLAWVSVRSDFSG